MNSADYSSLKHAIDLSVKCYLKYDEEPVDLSNENERRDLKMLADIFADKKREILAYIRKNEDDMALYDNVEALRDMISLLHGLGMYQSPPEEL